MPAKRGGGVAEEVVCTMCISGGGEGGGTTLYLVKQAEDDAEAIRGAMREFLRVHHWRLLPYPGFKVGGKPAVECIEFVRAQTACAVFVDRGRVQWCTGSVERALGEGKGGWVATWSDGMQSDLHFNVDTYGKRWGFVALEQTGPRTHATWLTHPQRDLEPHETAGQRPLPGRSRAAPGPFYACTPASTWLISKETYAISLSVLAPPALASRAHPALASCQSMCRRLRENWSSCTRAQARGGAGGQPAT